MDQIEQYFNRHQYSSRIGSAMVYAVASAVALNFFWTPGHIYSSGFTGLAQLLNTLLERFVGWKVPVGVLLLLINVPLMITAYRKIGKRFAMFTAVALVLAAVAMRLVSQPEQLWTHDPLVMAIFGGAVNGF